MKIGMTGNRYSMSDDAKKALNAVFDKLEVEEVHHGDCIGADQQFHHEAHARGMKIVIHPPYNKKHRAYCSSKYRCEPKSYLDRNKDIVNESDLLIAFPSDSTEYQRSGTWSTVRYARKTSKAILIILPSGQVIRDK